MDDTLLKYDESLEALEKQREDLERVMKKMGAEWEESGAGIGWMGDILYKDTATTNNKVNNSTTSSPPLMSLMHSVTSSISEPSHDYLQSLLNVNDELLAQSLASTTADTTTTTSNNYHPQLLKPTPFISQHMPLSPISPPQEDSNNQQPTATETVAINSIVQFTPPITPDE